MAWYYGTFACGCEGRVNIIGPNKDRQRKADWHFSKDCKDCYKKKMDEQALKTAKEWELPDLEGSDKQVSWALIIRQKLIDKFEEDAQIATSEDIKYSFNDKLSSIEEIERVLLYILKNKTKATYYIDNRFFSLRDHILLNLDDGLKTEMELDLEKEKEDAVKEMEKEATVFPKNNISNLVAKIHFNDKYVTVSYEKNKTFSKVVKELGYRWDGVWKKDITETTGSAEDRAAELGNRLLNEGFPIMILDEVVRENAINGVFEEECTRWIFKRKDEDLLAINWIGYDDNLYKKARTLPGAKWSSPSVVVNMAHFKEVEDFANLYGFKFTKKAIDAIEKYKKSLIEIDSVNPVKIEKKEIKDGLQNILESSDEILDDLKD